MDTISLAKIRSDARLQRERDYWREVSLADTPALQLGSAAPNPINTPAYTKSPQETFAFELDAAALLTIAKNSDAALFTILAAAVRHLGLRCGHSGERLIFTAPFSSEYIGDGLADLLPLKLNAQPQDSVRALLNSTRSAVQGAHKHQNYPLAAILHQANSDGETSNLPAAQAHPSAQSALEQPATVILLENLQNPRYLEETEPGLLFKFKRSETRLHCTVKLGSQQSADVKLKTLAEILQQLLQAYPSSLQSSLAQLEIIGPALRSRLLHEWAHADSSRPNMVPNMGPNMAPSMGPSMGPSSAQNTAASSGSEEDKFVSLPDMVLEQAALTPQAPALLDHKRTLSYAELNTRINNLVAALHAHGVGPETAVAVCMRRIAYLPATMLGVMASGAMLVPLDPKYPTERLEYMLRDSGAELVVTDIAGELRAQGLQVACIPPFVSDAAGGQEQSRSDQSNARTIYPRSAAYCIYTSGSTGEPKAVVVAHAAVAKLITWCAEVFTSEDLQCVAATTSVCFDISVFELFAPLAFGGSVLVAADAFDLADHHLADKLTLLNTVPSAIAALLNKGALPNNLRVVNLAGEALRSSLAQSVLEAVPGAKLFNLFGPTETTVYASFAQVLAQDNPPAIGRPVSGTLVYVLDDNMQLLPPGIHGNLYIGGELLARGYFKRGATTATRFVPCPFDTSGAGARLYHTGDIASFTTNGQLLFHGRADDQLKIRGYRIEPGEIEVRLLESKAVEACAVIVDRPQTEDSLQHARLAAFVQISRASAPDVDVNSLRQELSARVPNWMLPTLWFEIEALPKLPNAKVDKSALRELIRERESAPEDAQPAADEAASNDTGIQAIEAQLLQIWRDVLRQPGIKRNDNFFAIGGDSILALQIVARAAQAQLTFQPGQMFLHQTPAALAPHVRRGVKHQAEQGIVTGSAPQTPVQRWFGALNLLQPAHWNQAVILSAPVGLTRARLSQIALELQQHHDALRMFVRPDGMLEFAEHAELSLTELHCKNLSSAEAVKQHAQSVHAGLNINVGPIWSLLLLHCADESIVIVSIHHLAVDVVSWGVLLEDIKHINSSLAASRPIVLPDKTTAFRDWARRLGKIDISAHMPALREVLNIERYKDIAPLPRDFEVDESQVNIEANQLIISATLDENTTKSLLHDVTTVYRTRIDELLLAALARALRAWTGEDRLLIAREAHGRQAPGALNMPDVSRTVAWFTTITPIALELPYNADWEEIVPLLKEQVRTTTEQGFVFNIAHYLQKQFQELPAAEIVFNYLGQLGDSSGATNDASDPISQEWHLRQLSPGLLRGAQNQRPWLLEVNAGVTDGQFHMYLAFSPELHEQDGMQALLERSIDELESLVQHCLSVGNGKYTPSDFPVLNSAQGLMQQNAALKLNQPQLDAVIKQIGGEVLRPPRLESILPPAPLQAGMLFFGMLQDDSGASSSLYTQVFDFSITGVCDAEKLRQAWNQVFNRHSALRAAFVWSADGVLLQLIHETVEVPWKEHDLSSVAVARQEQMFKTLQNTQVLQGFDAEQAPLSRFFFYRTGPANWRLFWVHHHAIVDGWSLPIVLGEVLHVYRDLVQERASELNIAPSYSNYAEWLIKADVDKARAFWRAELQGFSAVTDLGFDRVFTDSTMRDDREFEHVFSKTMTEDLVAAARKYRVTLNTLMQYAWARVLALTTGRDEVLFGFAVSGRSPQLPDMDAMVGMFINTIPARFNFSSVLTLEQELQLARDNMARREEYAYVTLPQILGWSDISAAELFNSILVFENFPFDKELMQDYAGMQVQHAQGRERTNYPLTLVFRHSDLLRCTYSYDATSLSPERVKQLHALFELVLHELLAPGRANQVFSLLSTVPESTAGTESVSGQQSESSQSVFSVFKSVCAQYPEQIALRGSSVNWTYADLMRHSQELAAWLWRWGVRPGDCVAIDLPRSPAAVALLPAILQIGAHYLPLDPQAPARRREFMLQAAASRFLVCRERPTWLPPECLAIEMDSLNLDQDVESLPELDVSAEAAAYLMFTSGSTGRPKGVIVPNRGILRLTVNNQFCELEPGDCFLHLASPAFDASTFEIWAPLLNGATLEVYEEAEIDPATLAARIESSQVTHMVLTTGLFHALAAEQAWMFKPLKALLVGGDVVAPARVKQVQEVCPQLNIINGYGPTENTTFSSTYSMPHSLSASQLRVPIGAPLPDSCCLILDKNMQPLPAGALGELYLGGAGLALGYTRRPGLTAERFVPDPTSATGARLYRSGDLARILPDGSIDFLGRRDKQVKVRGFRIELSEVETQLRTDSAIRQAAVVMHNQQLCAFVALHAENEELNQPQNDVETSKSGTSTEAIAAPIPLESAQTSEIRRRLKQFLPDYMLPGKVYALTQLPLNASGKIDRRALLELIPASVAQVGAVPQTAELQHADTATNKMAFAEALLEIMRTLLNVPGMHLDDGFFEQGGNSISAIQLVARASNAGMRVRLRDVFENPRARELAECVQTGASDRRADIADLPLQLLPAQAWFFEKEFADAHHFNLAVLLRLKRAVEPADIARAVKQLLATHPQLTNVFSLTERGPRVHRTADASAILHEVELDGPSDVKTYTATAQSAFTLDGTALFGVHVIRLRDESLRLFIVAHHLIMDVVSLRIIVDELQTSLILPQADSRPGHQPAVEEGARIQAHNLRKLIASPGLEEELKYWRDLTSVSFDDLPAAGLAEGGPVESGINTLTFELYAASALDLQKRKTAIDSLLLAALSTSLRECMGMQDFLIELEHHGRDTIYASADDNLELSRALGWFTIMYPLRVKPQFNLPATLKQIEADRDSIAHDGLAFAVARYLAPEQYPGLLSLPPAPVVFNYLGDTDASFSTDLWEFAAESMGEDRANSNAAQQQLTVNVWSEADSLHARIICAADRCSRSAIEQLADKYTEQLALLLEQMQLVSEEHAEVAAPTETIEKAKDAGLDARNMAALMEQIQQSGKGAMDR